MYDSIVVGAGPAGGASAYHLAKQGRSVLIIEKESLPRYKPCGGGVSPLIAKWFDFDFSPAISSKASGLRCTWIRGAAIDNQLSISQPVWMVRRDVFDNFLVEQARKLGAELRDATLVEGVEFKGDYWEVSTANGNFCARYLIAADGASGPMAKWLGFKQSKSRDAAVMETQVSQNLGDDTTLHFDFGGLKNGYIWGFPKADGYSVSIATFIDGAPQELTPILEDYARDSGLDINIAKIYNHPICLWNGERTLHTQNALLVGEAAGIVDPFTGEGIRPSIYTAVKAAEAIDKALAGNNTSLSNYTATVNQEWGSEMAWAKKLASIFYRFPAAGYKVGVKRPTGPQLMGKILCGELCYSDVASSAIKRLLPFG